MRSCLLRGLHDKRIRFNATTGDVLCMLALFCICTLGKMLVQSLPEGPLDIVGDIHGEYGALLSLMDRMGYDYEGCHGEGRIMVFVGDLIDRGPDSISVVRLVRRLVEAKRAYCILGNHELNVLLGKANSGSKWLYGEKESLIRDKKDRHTLQALADEATRCEILDFLQNLPIVLERSDVRVVHAAWDDAAVDKLRSSKFRTVLDAYYFYKSEVDNRITSLLKTSTARAERDQLLAKWTPTGADGLGPNQRYEPVSEDELYIQCGELMHQNENPVNVVLSGFEEVSPSPFFAGGKERTLRRKRWWNHYPSDSPLVVFGHYWRKASHTESNSEDPHLFGFDESGKVSCQPFSLLYTSERYVNAACVDYSIGRRYIERAEGKISGETGNLHRTRSPVRLLLASEPELEPSSQSNLKELPSELFGFRKKYYIYTTDHLATYGVCLDRE